MKQEDMKVLQKVTKHSHPIMWVAIGIAYGIILLISFLVATHLKVYKTGEMGLEAFLGIMGTFIAICAAIMVAAQIYAIYNRIQVEKEYDEKLNEVKCWFSEIKGQYDSDLTKMFKATEKLNVLKYHINEAMGGVHYSEGKKLEGIVDVMENVYIFTSNETMFLDYFNNSTERISAAPYFIAKNMKEYASDIMVIKGNTQGLKRILNRWNKRYSQLNNDLLTVHLIIEDLIRLNTIFNKVMKGLIETKGHYSMERDDYMALCSMASD